MNTVLRDLSIIWTLIHCCVMFLFLYESRYSRKKTNIITAVFMIPIIALNLLNVWILGIERAGNFIIPCCVLPSLVFFFIMAKNRGTKFLFTFCLVDTIVLDVLFLTNLLDGLCGVENYVVMFVSRLIIFPLLEFLIVKYLREPYHFMQQNIKKGWGVFSILSMLFYITMLLMTYYPTIILNRPEYIPQLLLILVLVPVMYVIVFGVLWMHLKLFRSENENQALNMQIKMVNERLTTSKKSEDRINILRHDMKHRMLMLSDYIKSGNIHEAEKYVNELIENIDRSRLKNYCDNHSVNVVLSHYSQIAEEKSIKLEINMNLTETLTVQETDLTVILSNGLDNAVNALETCDNKIINIKGFNEADKIYLEIRNPFSDKIIFDGGLPKSEQENHGFGTKSMAAIVEKYKGVYSFDIENGYFIFQCSM